MVTQSVRATRTQQIDGILTGIEHAWKITPDVPLGPLLESLLGENIGDLSDEEVATKVRDHLQRTMSRSRDET
jgi:hypothetical protein